MSLFFRDGVNFHYEVLGEGEPLIMLHGLGGDLGQPKGLIEPVPGYSLIVMDQRAHGETDIRDFQSLSFAQMAADVLALADELKLGKFTVGGISMGAAVSVRLALSHPERIKKVILIRCAWTDGPMAPRIREWYKNLAKYLVQEDGLHKYKESEVYRQVRVEAPKTCETFERLFRERASLRFPEKYLVLPSRRPMENIKELDGLELPVLILANRNDPVHMYEYGEIYTAHLKNGEFHEITSKQVDEQRHKEEVNRYVRMFLSKA